MDQKTMVKQTLEFQKSTWDSMYQGMVALQDQAEKTVGFFLTGFLGYPRRARNRSE